MRRTVLTSVAMILASAAACAADRRIGIVGIDTSHVVEFSKIFNGTNPAPEFSGYRIGKVYRWGSRDIVSCTNRHEKYTAELKSLGVAVSENLKEVIDDSDYVLLETNDGRERYRQSVELFKSGKRVFIDKPLAHDLPDVIRVLGAARKHGASFFTSSSTRFEPEVQAARRGDYGPIRGCDTVTNSAREPHHSRYYWYAMHGVEALIAVMGPDVVSVRAVGNETEDILIGLWNDGRMGTVRVLDFSRPGRCSGGTIYPAKDNARVVFGGIWRGYGILLDPVLRFLESGVTPVDPDETLAVYAFCTAAEQSLAQGGAEVKVADVLSVARAEARCRDAVEAAR